MLNKVGLTIVDSALAMGMVSLAFWVGMEANTVAFHDRRLDSIEQKGSSALRSHEAEDDARVDELKTRIAKLEAITSDISDIKGDLRAIAVKLDAVKETMEKHVTSRP